MLLTSPQVRPELMAFEPRLVIFDKGGTLIDFRAMWTPWLVEMAQRLETKAGLAVAEQLFTLMGYKPDSGAIDPLGHLAMDSRSELKRLTGDLLCDMGLDASTASKAIEAVWFEPDPVADARPTADLESLFQELRQEGLIIAVATMDDRGPTEDTLVHLNVWDWVDALVCADDGVKAKPSPDIIWSLCRETDVSPAHTIVVGDSITDMQMGRAAGVGLVVGVLSGVASSEMLADEADILLDCVDQLI